MACTKTTQGGIEQRLPAGRADRYARGLRRNHFDVVRVSVRLLVPVNAKPGWLEILSRRDPKCAAALRTVLWPDMGAVRGAAGAALPEVLQALDLAHVVLGSGPLPIQSDAR